MPWEAHRPIPIRLLVHRLPAADGGRGGRPGSDGQSDRGGYNLDGLETTATAWTPLRGTSPTPDFAVR